ncbi:MAG TPA: hypothetical protein VEP30_04505 [Chthoniobacterales bacterium]|nr:hypothetical protein [Chthoniobacterales bacterium]
MSSLLLLKSPFPLAILGLLLSSVQGWGETEVKELPPVRLDSGIDKVYSKPFVLKKENVLDIATILLKKASELPGKTQFLVHVTRKDDRFFEASDVNAIFSDPNSATREVDSVTFALYDLQQDNLQGGDKPRQIVLLTYQNFGDPKVRAKVTGASISWSLLVVDELNAQIERTLVSNWNITRVSTLVLATLLILSLLWILYRFSYSRMENMTSSTFLVMHIFQMVTALTVVTLFFGVLNFSRVVAWLKSSNGIFSWGDMSEAYSRQQAFGDSLFWTVAVGFVVSLITNLITARVASAKKAPAPQA